MPCSVKEIIVAQSEEAEFLRKAVAQNGLFS
jgi:hypothetical protein